MTKVVKAETMSHYRMWESYYSMFLVKKKKYKWEDRKVTSSICRGKRTINPDSSFEDYTQELVASRVPHTKKSPADLLYRKLFNWEHKGRGGDNGGK